MNVYSVVGLQWGDEGKGKIVDILSDDLDYCVRYQGGNNCGHTVVIDNEKFVLNLLPSSVLHNKVKCIIGPGVVADIIVLDKELNNLKEKGVNTNNVFIDYKTHLIMPYHIQEDKRQEKLKGRNSIGTTVRGIGPAYTDKYSRIGLRVMDLFLNAETLRNKLNFLIKIKNISAEYTVEKLYNLLQKYKEIVQGRVIDSTLLLNKMIDKDKKILFEGAQAALLDIDHGTYPYVTSSNTISGTYCTGVGLSPKKTSNIFGVFKAYCTRVGKGIFPTEINNEVSDYIINKGKEYGSTTGRKRRIGWLDLVALKYSILINGIDSLVMTKLDILTGLKEIKICIGYKIEGKVYKHYQCWLNEMHSYKLIYKTFPGWTKDISKVRQFDDLPIEAKNYATYIMSFIGMNISLISVGPGRSENIHINNIKEKDSVVL